MNADGRDTGALFVSFTDAEDGGDGSARWGGLTDAQLDAALLALTRVLGEPDTIT